MSKDGIDKSAPQNDHNGPNDPNGVNGKIIGGAWLFSNRMVEKIELESHSPPKETTDSSKDQSDNEPGSRT